MARTDRTSTIEQGYACFISYRHSDNTEESGAWASWLHETLERYEVPPALIGQPNRAGNPIPARIYPVFRDETSAASSGDLHDELHEALRRSENLIVICTPGAAASTYIDEEIRFFKALKGADHVFGVVVAGDPGAREGDSQDCQPRALRYKVDADGQLTDEPENEILFPDVRTSAGKYGIPDKRAYIASLRKAGMTSAFARKEAEAYGERIQMMKLKIIAGLLDIPLDDLLQRQQLYQARQTKAAEREALWTFYAFMTLPLLIAATWVWSYSRKVYRAQDMDLSAPLSDFGNLIYMQMTADNIGSLFVVVAGLMAVVTIRIRNSLQIRHILAIMGIFVILAAGTVVAIEKLAPPIVSTAQRLDDKAAAGEFIVDACAPNARLLFDQYRDPSGPVTPVAPRCDEILPPEPRGPILNVWRHEVGPLVFAPLVVLLFAPFLILLGLRLRAQTARR